MIYFLALIMRLFKTDIFMSARSPPTYEEPELKPTQTQTGEQQPQEVGSCMGLQFKVLESGNV